MLIAIITLGLITGTALLIKRANSHNSVINYSLVLASGLVTFLFEPIIIALYTDGTQDGGIIQIASTLIGLYAFTWSIVKIIKIVRKR